MAEAASGSVVEALLAELEASQIKLSLEDDRLKFSAPPGALTPELRARLQQHKPAIIDFLRNAPGVAAPPSFPQRRFWTLQQLNPTATFYNDPFLFRLRGPLDSAVLRRSFNTLVARHEILRTTLQQKDGELWQIIRPAGTFDLIEEDLNGETPERVFEVLYRHMHRPFDLANDPGLRAVLVRAGGEEHFLQLCFHNTVFDLFSLWVVLNELCEIYSASLSGRPPALPSAIQYTSYVQAQESGRAEGMEARRRYWEEWFELGDPPAWSWSGAKAPPTEPSFNSHVTWIRRTPEQTAAIHAMCRRHGVTPFIVVLTALYLTMRIYTECSDLTIGTTYSNRDDWRFSSMIGATLVVPALRFDSGDDPTLGVLLRRVKTVLAGALRYQDIPADQVVQRGSGKPLFRVVCSAFPETPHGKLNLPGIDATWIDDWIDDVSRPDLYLVMWENPSPDGGGLTCYTMHKQDVFEREAATAMVGRFEAILDGFARDSAQHTSTFLRGIVEGC